MRAYLRRRYVAATAAAIVVGILSIGACSTSDDSSLPSRILGARKANVTDPTFVDPKAPQDTASERTLLLFIHGIFGDTVETWCNENGSCLPQLVLTAPEFFGRVDAFVFGYPSTVFQQGSFSIPEAAKALETEIRFHKLSGYQRIVIVAHSMGGLVALEALTSYPHIAAKVPLIVSYASPYNGSQVAAIGRKLLDNPALADMVPVDANNSLITSLTNRWKTQRTYHEHPTRVICAYEKIAVPPLFSAPIVPQSSAVALCDEAADAVAEDHIGIVKPSGINHASYKILINALRRLNESTARSTFVDVSTLVLLAGIEDRETRLKIYKKISRTDKIDPEVLSFLDGFELSGTRGRLAVDIPAGEVDAIDTPEQLAAFATERLTGLPCGGKLDFRVVDDRLVCAGGGGITQTSTPNMGGDLRERNLIVFHSAGSPSLPVLMKALANPNLTASTHILVGRDGSIVQVVPFDKRAWHAGVSKWRGRSGANGFSIGILLLNGGLLDEKDGRFQAFGGQEIDAGDVEGAQVGMPWQKYTAAQIAVTTAITHSLSKTYGIREIAGHCHVSPGRKRDPGPYFPFEKIQKEALGFVNTLEPCGA